MKTSNRVGIRTCSDYSPFGVELDGRTVSGGYRYGYQGSEKDNETKGNGNSYTTEFRQLDPRLGRWLSVDPLSFKFPWQSPYIQANNNPIIYSDNKGLEAEDWIKIREKRGDKYMNKVVYDSNITTDEEAIKKYGQNASKLEYGFQYHSEFNDQITLLENGTYDVNGSMRQATDLCSTGVSTEGNCGEESESQPNNSIMQQFIGDPNSSNHIDWNIDPSKHHYMYDFDDKMQKGCFYGAAVLSTGGFAIEASPFVISAFSTSSQYSLLASKLGLNYICESISNESLNPFNHNSLSYIYSALIPKVPSIPKQILIGSSSGLIEYKLSSNKFLGFWNQNSATTTLKVINGATSPFLGNIYGNIIRQGIGGNGINQLDKKLNQK